MLGVMTPRVDTMRLLALVALVLLSTVGNAEQRYERGLLWRLDKPGVPASYVFGTLHSNDPRVTALPLPVQHAFAASNTFAMEVYLSEIEETEFFEASQFGDGQRLEPLLGEAAFAQLKRTLSHGAVADDVLSRTKPWAALLRIATSDQNRGAATVDRELFVAARERRMTVVGLESVEEQVAAFDGIPIETQIALLRHALDHRAELQARLEPTIRAWLAGDLATLSRLSHAMVRGDAELAHHYAALTRHLIDNRSVLMAHRLFLPLRAGRVFVAVGASHLYGDHGLLALLRAQGYQPHRVY